MSWLSKFWRKREKEIKKFLREGLKELTLEELLELLARVDGLIKERQNDTTR